MDSKAIKSILKKAKEAIKNKEIPTALTLCKAVLKEDRSNYIALVLLGAAFQESDQKEQAPNAFRKAIEVSPDQILAWQGLASFYERDSSSKHVEHLVPVYQQLLLLESESSKWCEIALKLQGVITKFESDKYVAQIIAEHKSTEDNAKLDALRKLVFHYLSHVDNIPEENLILYKEVLNSPTAELQNEHVQIYLKLLYDQNKPDELLRLAEEYYQNDSQDCNAAEWICKVCAEEFVNNRNNVLNWVDKLPQYYKRLLEEDGNNILALMAQGTYLMSQHSYPEARQCLQHCLSLNSGLFHAVCLLSEVQLRMQSSSEAKRLANTASSLRPQHLAPRALLAASMVLCEQASTTDCQSAVQLAKEVLTEGLSELAAEALCHALLRLGHLDELSSALPCLTHAPALQQLIQLEAGAVGQELLMSLAQNTPNCPEAWYRLGNLYIEADSLDQAIIAFLKCAKLAPYWYSTYLRLGHLYRRDSTAAGQDKARRCYQRALLLCPNNREVQEALSDVYRAMGDTASNLALLQNITQNPEGRWVWPRLGLQYSDIGDTTSAISCLRSALKSAPDDSHLWEALADAFLIKGANGSALKSYQKVLELRSEAFYPALQIATIKQITDLPEESLLEFRELVVKQPTSVLALKGLCETCLCLAKDFLTRRLLGLGRDRLQEALKAVSKALAVRPELACLWKLASDCLSIAGTLPRHYSWLIVPSELSTTVPAQPQSLRGLQLLRLGARCLCRCLKLMGESREVQAAVWNDLAYNYCHQAQLSSESDASEYLTASEKALAAAKQSVTLDPHRWQHWNQLGIVAALPSVKRYVLAQHAFIKATMADDTVAAPWSNLGCLYLVLDNVQLANRAFSAAQRIDSEFCPSWVGQAIIAESVDNEDTMDLFRHSAQLCYHAESSLGYAQWVCQTVQAHLAENTRDLHYIYNIERMHAIPVAVDALTWATDEQEEACGLNMLGCLLEKCGLYSPSASALSRAVDLAPADHRDKALANFGRVLVKAGKIDDAVQVYRAIGKADIHSQCGLALALYKGKQYQEAFEAYEAALNWWAADDEVRGNLHVALAAVAYKMVGPDKSKALLLQSNQLKPVSVHGLLATCALGMLNSDLELSKTVLKDLINYQHCTRFTADVALFQAYTRFIEGDAKGSVCSMSTALHSWPSIADLWLHLALLILNKQSLAPDTAHRVLAAARCAQAAMALGRNNMDVSKVLAVVSLSHLLGGDYKRALVASQHAVHLYPQVGESWAVLAASCAVVNNLAGSSCLRSLVSHARQHTDLERPLAKWMSNFERKLALSSS